MNLQKTLAVNLQKYVQYTESTHIKTWVHNTGHTIEGCVAREGENHDAKEKIAPS